MTGAAIAVVAGLALAALAGWLLTRRSGVFSEIPTKTGPGPAGAVPPDAVGLELAGDGPTVVHFSAPWCGPCAQVRRVVDQVCAELGGVAHAEVDIDANPVAARKLSVLSLPTTVIFDAGGRQRYRTTGVPSGADLRSALEQLLA